MKIERLQVYDYDIGEEREERGFLRGRTWFYEDGTPMTDVAVLAIKGHRDPRPGKQFQRMKAISNPEPKWYFIGDPEKRYFATKLEAEAATRRAFPDESGRKRYARVFYREEGVENPYPFRDELVDLAQRSGKLRLTHLGKDVVVIDKRSGDIIAEGTWKEAYDQVMRRALGVENPQGYAPEYEREPIRRRPPPPPQRRDEEEWRKHLGYPPEGVTNPYIVGGKGKLPIDGVVECQLSAGGVAEWLTHHLGMSEFAAQGTAKKMITLEKALANKRPTLERAKDIIGQMTEIVHGDLESVFIDEDGFLVEEDDDSGLWNGAEYLNIGDAYSPTVIFDYAEEKFFFISYNDWANLWIERHGDEF